jgi:glycosyltransferase involved in cell wall biosynthesis
MNEPDVLNPLVSVIVTTRNEERNIGNCLQSIQLQTYKPIEIIVVDNNSTDKTQKIACSFTDVVVNKGPERSAQRNHGICGLAKGEFAMFIDADMILTPTLVESCVEEFEAEGVVALHIDEVILGRGKLANARRFERSFYSGTVIDGARFFNRSTFCKLGGFDEVLPPGPEDWDLDLRLRELGNIRLLANKSEPVKWELSKFVGDRGVQHSVTFVGIYHNEDDQSLRKYLKKKMYYGPSMKVYKEKWPKDRKEVRQQLGFRYRFFVVFCEEKKYKKIFSHPITFFGVILLKIAVALAYITALIFVRTNHSGFH